MQTRVLIYGGGGHGRVVLDILRARAGDNLCAVFLDDNPVLQAQVVDGVPVHNPDALPGLLREGFAYLVGIGDNQTRSRLYHQLKSMGFQPATAMHPSAVVSPRASLGEGVVLMPGAIVNTGARVEENACINTAASVDHDAVVGAHAHLFPGARLTGNVRVERYARIGTGALVLPGVRIGHNAVVGAGALVRNDVPDNAVAFGVPAQVVRSRPPVASLASSVCGS